MYLANMQRSRGRDQHLDVAGHTCITPVEEEAIIDLYNAEQQQQAAIPPVRSIPRAPVVGIQMRPPNERKSYLLVQGRWSAMTWSM